MSIKKSRLSETALKAKKEEDKNQQPNKKNLGPNQWKIRNKKQKETETSMKGKQLKTYKRSFKKRHAEKRLIIRLTFILHFRLIKKNKRKHVLKNKVVLGFGLYFSFQFFIGWLVSSLFEGVEFMINLSFHLSFSLAFHSSFHLSFNLVPILQTIERRFHSWFKYDFYHSQYHFMIPLLILTPPLFSLLV